jgi:hypothetical protein
MDTKLNEKSEAVQGVQCVICGEPSTEAQRTHPECAAKQPTLF